MKSIIGEMDSQAAHCSAQGSLSLSHFTDVISAYTAVSASAPVESLPSDAAARPRERKRARRSVSRASTPAVDHAIVRLARVRGAADALKSECAALQQRVERTSSREERNRIAGSVLTMLLAAQPLPSIAASVSASVAEEVRSRLSWLPAQLLLLLLLRCGAEAALGAAAAASAKAAPAASLAWVFSALVDAFPDDVVEPLTQLASEGDGGALLALDAVAAEAAMTAALGSIDAPAALLASALRHDPPLSALAAQLVTPARVFEWQTDGEGVATAAHAARHAVALGGACCLGVLIAVEPARWGRAFEGDSAPALLAVLRAEVDALCALACGPQRCPWTTVLLRVCCGKAAGPSLRGAAALRVLLVGRATSRWAAHLAYSLCTNISTIAGRILLTELKALAVLEATPAPAAAVSVADAEAEACTGACCCCSGAEAVLVAILSSRAMVPDPGALAVELWGWPALASVPSIAPLLLELPQPPPQRTTDIAPCAAALRLMRATLDRATNARSCARCAAAAAAAQKIVLRLSTPQHPHVCAELVLSVAVNAIATSGSAPPVYTAWLNIVATLCANVTASAEREEERELRSGGRATHNVSYVLRRLEPLFLGRRPSSDAVILATWRSNGKPLRSAAYLPFITTEEAAAHAPLRSVMLCVARAAWRPLLVASSTVAAVASRLIVIACSRLDETPELGGGGLRRLRQRAAPRSDGPRHLALLPLRELASYAIELTRTLGGEELFREEEAAWRDDAFTALAAYASSAEVAALLRRVEKHADLESRSALCRLVAEGECEMKVATLQQLERLPSTVAKTEPELVRSVKDLRKHSIGTVAAAAKALLQRWKNGDGVEIKLFRHAVVAEVHVREPIATLELRAMVLTTLARCIDNPTAFAALLRLFVG